MIKTQENWSRFTEEELARAIELLIVPEWLMDRQTMIAILESQDLAPDDVKSQLRANEQLNDGPALSWNF